MGPDHSHEQAHSRDDAQVRQAGDLHDREPHDHGPTHGHSHRGGHSHGPANFGAAFAIGIALNFCFVGVEAVYGVLGHSVALLADSGHNLGDVLGLAVAGLASALTRRGPSARYTYGLRGSSILAALFNAVFLLVTVGAISWEAILRLGAPAPVAGKTVMIVAALGIVINGVTALLFASGNRDDLNVRAAFLHMASDALVSVGVVVTGLLIVLTGWSSLDPLVSLVVNAVIVWGTWGLMRDALDMAMAAVPAKIDPAKIREFLLQEAGVAAIHDLHVWSMSTTEIALTCHLVMPNGHPGDAFLHGLVDKLTERFEINHPTLQIEIDPQLVCSLASDDVV